MSQFLTMNITNEQNTTLKFTDLPTRRWCSKFSSSCYILMCVSLKVGKPEGPWREEHFRRRIPWSWQHWWASHTPDRIFSDISFADFNSLVYFYSFQGVLTDRSLFPLETAYARLEKQSIFNIVPCKVILDQYTCKRTHTSLIEVNKLTARTSVWSSNQDD